MKNLTLIFSLALVTTGCADDPIERAIDLQSETRDYLCGCAVENGDFPDRASCEQEPDFAPPTAAFIDCYERVLNGAPSADVEAIECGLDASEAQLSCLNAAGCTLDAQAQACADEFEAASNACPQISELTESMFSTCFGDDG